VFRTSVQVRRQIQVWELAIARTPHTVRAWNAAQFAVAELPAFIASVGYFRRPVDTDAAY